MAVLEVVGIGLGIIVSCTIIGAFIGRAVNKKFENFSGSHCTVQSRYIATLGEASNINMQVTKVILESLERISRGEKTNGSIKKEQDKIDEFLQRAVFKSRKDDKNGHKKRR